MVGRIEGFRGPAAICTHERSAKGGAEGSGGDQGGVLRGREVVNGAYGTMIGVLICLNIPQAAEFTIL